MTLTPEQLDTEVLRVIKVLARPLSLTALYAIFDEELSLEVRRVVWRHLNQQLDFDDKMRVAWRKK